MENGQETKTKYFNFPIQLLDGFMVDHMKVLNDIFSYAVYKHAADKLTEGTIAHRWGKSLNYFGVTGGVLKNGKLLYDSIPVKSPIAGISIEKYFDFYKNEKTDFEKATLLAYLALKSILGKDSYQKLDNAYLLSRMDGKVKSFKDNIKLSDEIYKYSHPYAVRKLKKELKNYWGLKEYSYYTRGFYVSFSMPLEELVFQAEKRKKSTKEKVAKKLQKEAREKALLRLNIELN